jgi:protein-tyrosine phosphatase
MGDVKIGVLFVCLGNICRSPLAQAVFRAQVEAEGLADRFDIDSAGTSSYHAGEPPDPRTVAVARRYGIEVEHAARQIRPEDFRRFDYVLAMDRANLAKVRRLADGRADGTHIGLLRAFDPGADGEAEVPDPYFGGPGGFEEVQAMVERACRGLLDHVRATHGV